MVQLRLSGGITNGSPNLSLGGALSSTEIVHNAANNLFDRLIKVELINENPDYRCVYVYNESATESLYSVRVMGRNTGSTRDISEGLGIAFGVEEGTAQNIQSESSSPLGIYFEDYYMNQSFEIPIGTLHPGEGKPLWIRRIPTLGIDTSEVNQFSVQIRGISEGNLEPYATNSNDGANFDDTLAVYESLSVSKIDIPSKLGDFRIGEGIMGGQ